MQLGFHFQISPADAKRPLPAERHRPLVPPVLDPLEGVVAAPPLLPFIAFDFFHLKNDKKG